MATAEFYVTLVVSDRPFHTEHVGVEVEYPSEYDSYVSTTGLILGTLRERLEAEGGLYGVHSGRWSEVLYVATDPETSWLSGGVVHVYRYYGGWCHPRLDRIVEWPEFVRLVREEAII